MAQSDQKPRVSKRELRIALLTVLLFGGFFISYLYYIVKITDMAKRYRPDSTYVKNDSTINTLVKPDSVTTK